MPFKASLSNLHHVIRNTVTLNLGATQNPTNVNPLPVIMARGKLEVHVYMLAADLKR